MTAEENKLIEIILAESKRLAAEYSDPGDEESESVEVRTPSSSRAPDTVSCHLSCRLP